MCVNIACIDVRACKGGDGLELEESIKFNGQSAANHYEDWAKALQETQQLGTTTEGGEGGPESPSKPSPVGNVLRITDKSDEDGSSPVTKALLKNMEIQPPKEETGLDALEEGQEIYEGQFCEQGSRKGFGSLKVKKGKNLYAYNGEFEEGVKSGKGVMIWGDGRQFRGQFIEDKLHGEGSMTWPDGSRYIGQYENNQKHGTGIFFFKEDGRQHQGQWRNGKRHGKGVYTSQEGKSICGHWANDEAIESSLDVVPELDFNCHGKSMVDKVPGAPG